jgi:uncharacterized protein YgiM (DUF1202 family)
MFKLTALLSVTMFLVMMIGGEDHGQLRPGLAMAAREAAQAPAPEAPADEPELVLASAPAATESPDVAPSATPVTVEPTAAAPVDNATDPVFSLANYDDDAPATVTEAAPAGGTLAYIDGRSVNVREGPGKENAVLTKLSRGEAVTVVSQDDTGWSRVRIEGDGLEGYVSTEFLTATAP